MRAALPFLTAAFAAASPTEWIQHTTIAIEAFHGEARAGLANLTLVIPVGPAYINKAALHAVSALYILEDDGVTCIPYSAEFAGGPQLVFLSHSFPNLAKILLLYAVFSYTFPECPMNESIFCYIR